MRMLRNRILTILVMASIGCSSCQAAWWNPLTWFTKKKSVKNHTVRNTVIGIGAFFIAAVAGYYVGKSGGQGPGPGPDLPPRPSQTERLNWQNMHTRAYELLYSLDDRKLIKGQRTLTVGGVENRIYQIKSTKQNGAQCGPSALFNASKLSQYFNIKKNYVQSIVALNGLSDKTLIEDVANLGKNRNIEWLLPNDLTDILRQGLVPGFDLGTNVFVYPALSFYSRKPIETEVDEFEEPLYKMNLKEKADGFSCSFIVPDYENEAELVRGHWICVHVVKIGNVFNWFIVCSMNYDILEKYSWWWEKIKFMIHMLLDESVHKLSFAKNIKNEKVMAHVNLLEDMPKYIERMSSNKGSLRGLIADLDNMKMLYLMPGCKEKMDLYRAMINIKLDDIKE